MCKDCLGEIMVKFLFFISLFISTGYCQKSAITDTGEEVLLYENGTWEYKKDDLINGEKISFNRRQFKKNNKSSFLLKSKKTDVAVWINPGKWTFTNAKENPDAEYEFQLKNEDAYGLLITERIEIPLVSLRNIALENAKSAAPDIQIVNEEFRNVNGNKVLMLEMEGSIEGIELTYYGYYYSNENGTNQLITYTSQNLFSAYRRDLSDLLNGMVEN